MSGCLICDDHAIVRVALAGVISRLRPQWDIRTAIDFPTALASIQAQPPMLCLADIQMPGATAEDGIASLKRALGTTPIIVVTGSNTEHRFKALFEIGISGILEKTSDLPVFESAIETVLKGGRYFAPHHLAMLGKKPRLEIRLTERQVDVLNLVAVGQSNKEIARQLEIAPATVKTHLESAMRLLGASSRTEAVFLWQRRAL